MSLKKSMSLLLCLCMVLSMFMIVPFSAFAANTEVADTGANVELQETGAGIYGLADNVQDGQILQCWNWSYQNIAKNMSTIAQQGFSAIQTSPIQPIKESTKEYYSTIQNASWVVYQPVAFSIEDNSRNAQGTKADFEYMCEQAHKYGVKVIVDVVLNHMANDMSENTLHPWIPSEIKDNSDCWHDISMNIYNYDNRYDVTHYCLTGLPDLNTANSTVQTHCKNFLKEAIAAGADGFRFDAAKHIETDWDADGTKSDFWKNVLASATNYAKENRGITPYYYGEMLGSPGGGLSIEAYTQYMSVTDPGSSDAIRNGVCNGDAAAAATGSIHNGASKSKTVQWTESHDNHKDHGTSGISENNINKTWAIVGSKDKVCGMYLARPEDMNTTMMGDADFTSWSYPEVKAVNDFKNRFIGQSEYLSSYNKLACVERGNSGMVIVNTGGSYYNGMSAPVHTMASGTYKDAITGNTFTVSDGYISGDIGDTGIAVVYDVDNSGVFTKGQVTDVSVSGSFNSWNTSADKMIAVDGTKASVSMFLDAGTYEFKVSTTTGIWYGNAGTINDTTGSSGWTMKSSVDDNCTLVATGGKYTFIFDVSTGKLVVEHEDTTDTTSDFYLKGTFNDWKENQPFVYSSGENIVTTTVKLDAGTYTFKINNPDLSVWYSNTGTINDTTGTTGWTMKSSVDDNCTLVATGGNYTFAFNLSTQKLTVTTDATITTATQATDAQETTAEVTTAAPAGTGFYLKGEFNDWSELNQFEATEDSKVVTSTLELDAGTYTFKVHDTISSKWRSNKGIVYDTTGTSGWTMSSTVTENCTLVATGGIYTFNFNTDTCKLVILHTPTETDPVETTIATYTVTFKDYNGMVLSEQKIEEGGSATAPQAPVREADAQYTYTFKEWDTDFTNVTKDITVTAVYNQTLNKYTVTFVDFDGTVLDTQSVEYGKSAAAPEDPAREGYAFTGWDVAFDNITQDITVTAQYIDATVYLKGSFNDWKETNPMTMSEDDSNIYTAVLQLEEGSYTFKIYHKEKWYGNTGKIADTTTATSSSGWLMETGKSNCTLTATGGTYTFNYNVSTSKLVILYEAPKYTVTFVDFDGTVLSTQTVTKGESAVAPDSPVREADAQYTYTFAGWDADFTDITKDTTVTATYTQTVNKYTVKFVNFDGTVLDTQSVEYGKGATAPADPVRAGDAKYTYTFKGWDADFTNITKDTTVTATYTQTVNKYTVKFVDFDGTVLDTQSVEYGKSATAPESPAREGYIFDGWDAEFANITKDTTITATYKEASAVTYTVTFKDYNGTVLKTETVAHGGSATPPLEPLRASTSSGWTTTYYIFDKWDVDYTNVQADTTVTAVYRTVTSNFMNRVYYYFVYFKDYDGTILKQQNVESGTTVTPPADPVRAGYTFTGWDKTNFTITAETTFTATYTENVQNYTVIFKDYDGTVLSTQTVAKGASAVAPETPVRAGDAQYTYTFNGWDADFTNITKDTTVTATYTQTVNKYTVKFVDFDGTVLDTQSVEYGKSATAPADPAREGYTFKGWDKDFAAITTDLTVTAQYEKKETPVAVPKGSLKIDVNSGRGFKISVNGGAARPQGMTYINSSIAVTTSVTVTAYEIESMVFLGWWNSANGQVLTTDYTYSFYTSGNDAIKAVYMVDYEDFSTVIFKNDKAAGGLGQIIDMQYYVAGDEVVMPDGPVQVGYDFAGWNMTADEIAQKVAAGEDVTVLATWTKQIIKVNVTVNGGQGSGIYDANYSVTVVADTAPAGQKFAYWVDGTGKVRSYETTYKFYPSADTTLTAVFVSVDEDIDYQILLSVDSIDTVNQGTSNVFYYSWYVPEEALGITFVDAGILAINKDFYDEGKFYVGSGLANMYDRGPSGTNIKPVNTYSWTKSNVPEGQTWVAKAYVQYKVNGSDEIITVYSDIVEATKE